jgi:hypothetical protein
VAASENACAIRASDNKVICWGGTGAIAAPAGPSDVAVKEVATTLWGSTCAVRVSDNQAVCWGASPAMQSPPSDPVYEITVGADFACALRIADSTPVCWGDVVPDVAGGVTSQPSLGLAVGGEHGCSILQSGKLACFGDDTGGAAPWLPHSGTFVSVAGGSAPCALDAAGHAQCWGPSNWQLGATAPGPSDVLRTVSSSDGTACGLDTHGSLRCWNDGAYGPPAPPATTLPGDLFRTISVSGSSGCGLRASDGAMSCWGTLDKGAFPDFGAQSFNALALAPAHLCAIDGDGKLLCWGSDALGAAPSGPSASSFSAVSTGVSHTCAIVHDAADPTMDQRLLCWGTTAFGAPAPAGPSDDRYRAVVSGAAHVCAIRSDDGKVVCWGRSYGPEGPSLGRYTALSAAGDATCGVRDDGKVVCWGSGHFGQSGSPVVLP